MKHTECTDTELLEKIVLNDSKAFKILHDKYASKMFFYAYNIIKDKEVCEDIIQNLFIDFWIKRSHSKINNVKSYLFRSVKYQVFNYFRDQKFLYEDLHRLNIIDISICASKKMEYHELEDAIQTSVAKLPKRCREIFELSRFQYKSNKEISEELNISIQAVKNQISKALISIRGDLEGQELHGYFILILSNIN